MTAPSLSAAPETAAVDDYTYDMQVRATLAQVIQAVTDDAVICDWWTAATGSKRDGGDVQLLMGDGTPFVTFTVEQAREASQVTWTVTDCAVMADWVGTRPSFSMRQNVDGTCAVEFRHIGLRPTLECFDQCRAGWNHFMPSLHQFLETGEGRPNQPRDPSA